ncbi:alpha/beta hydrolase, partial [Streptomyces vinaceus]
MSSTELPGVRSASEASPQVGAVHVAEGEQLRTVVLPGLELTVRSRPPLRTGLPPALFVHGLGGSSTNWTDLMAQLEGRGDGPARERPR